jgi:hypothetical protein
MVSYTVGSWTDILSLPVLAGGDTVTMSTNFSTTDNTNKLSLNGASFNGSNYTLTWGEGRSKSPFTELLGGVIQNLTLDGSMTNVSVFGESFVVSGSGHDNYGTIKNVVVNNAGILENCSCIAGNFGHVSFRSLIEDCTVNMLDNMYSAGGICQVGVNVDILRCTVNIDTHRSGGGILYQMTDGTNVEECVVNIASTIPGSLYNNGGIVQRIIGDNMVFNIKNCYTNWTGDGSIESSGIVHQTYGNSGDTTINITNCHTNYTGGNAGFIKSVASNSSGNLTLNIISCYSSGVTSDFSIIDSWSINNSCIVNLDGVYTNGGSGYSPVPPSGGTVNNVSSFLSISDIQDTLTIPDRWVTNNSTFAMRNPGLPEINGVVVPDIVIPCFLPGTMIRTANGDIPIEKLSSNDFVTTTQGEKNIIEKIVIECNDSKIKDYEKPVCFTKGCLGNNLPSKDLWASRFHKILYNGEMLCANELFLRKDPICKMIIDTFDKKVTEVIYHHLVLEGNYPYYANDVVAESAGNSETHSLSE